MILIRGVDGSLRTPDGDYVLRTHEVNDECFYHGCVVHSPSLSSMSSWTLNWRGDRGMMERLCPTHGVGHPDPDQVGYWSRHLSKREADAQAVHGCCGCEH